MAGIPAMEPYPMPVPDELPENLAGWVVDPQRAVLLVHDMQHYFLRRLPDAPRRPLIGNCARLRQRCVDSGIPVCYTAQPGDMTAAERGLLRDFWGTGMRTAPADREVVPELAPAAGDRVFTKWRYSAFYRSDLLGFIRDGGRDQLVLCGVYAHVGVLATAIDAFTRNIETFLVADAVADFSAAHHRMALDYAASRCAVVRGMDAVLDELTELALPGVGVPS